MNCTLNHENTHQFAAVIHCLGKYHGTINFNVQSQLIRFYGYDTESGIVALFARFHQAFFTRFSVLQSFPKDFTLENPKHLEAAFRRLKYVEKTDMWVKRDTENGHHFYLMIELHSSSGLKKTFKLSIDKATQSSPNQVDQYWMKFRAPAELMKQHLEKIQTKVVWAQFSYLQKDYLMIGSDSQDANEESLITSTVVNFSELESISFAPGIDTLNEAKNITREDQKRIKRLIQTQTKQMGQSVDSSPSPSPQASNVPRKKKIQVSVRLAHLKPFVQLCCKLKSSVVANLTPTMVDLDGAHALFETVTSNALLDCTLHSMARESPDDTDEPRPDPVSQRTLSIHPTSSAMTADEIPPTDSAKRYNKRRRDAIEDEDERSASLRAWSNGRYHQKRDRHHHDDDDDDESEEGIYGRIGASPSPPRSRPSDF